MYLNMYIITLQYIIINRNTSLYIIIHQALFEREIIEDRQTGKEISRPGRAELQLAGNLAVFR